MRLSRRVIQRFRRARRDRELTVIEGFHALKHALRFGAELVEAVAVDPERARGAGARSWRPTSPASWPAGSRRSTRRRWRDRAAGAAHRRRRDRPPPAGRRRRDARRPAAGPGGPARGPAQHGQHRRLRAGRRRGRRRRDADHRRERPLVSRTPSAAPPACTSPCRSPRSRPCRRATGRCWRSTPRERTCGPSGCRRAPSSPSAPSATASAASCWSAPTPGSRSRCAPASPASTSPPRSRSCCFAMRTGENYGCRVAGSRYSVRNMTCAASMPRHAAT